MYPSFVEAIRFETTAGQGGTLTVPDAVPGERVEVIVLKLEEPKKFIRKRGWMKGKTAIGPDIDESALGMEEYMGTGCCSTCTSFSGFPQVT